MTESQGYSELHPQAQEVPALLGPQPASPHPPTSSLCPLTPCLPPPISPHLPPSPSLPVWVFILWVAPCTGWPSWRTACALHRDGKGRSLFLCVSRGQVPPNTGLQWKSVDPGCSPSQAAAPRGPEACRLHPYLSALWKWHGRAPSVPAHPPATSLQASSVSSHGMSAQGPKAGTRRGLGASPRK